MPCPERVSASALTLPGGPRKQIKQGTRQSRREWASALQGAGAEGPPGAYNLVGLLGPRSYNLTRKFNDCSICGYLTVEHWGPPPRADRARWQAGTRGIRQESLKCHAAQGKLRNMNVMVDAVTVAKSRLRERRCARIEWASTSQRARPVAPGLHAAWMPASRVQM